MTFFVDANVLSEATRPEPDAKVLAWLAAHESEIVVDRESWGRDSSTRLPEPRILAAQLADASILLAQHQQ